MDDYMTTCEVARLLRVSPSTLRGQRHEGREVIRSFKIGSSVKYLRAEVNQYVRRHHL